MEFLVASKIFKVVILKVHVWAFTPLLLLVGLAPSKANIVWLTIRYRKASDYRSFFREGCRAQTRLLISRFLKYQEMRSGHALKGGYSFN